MSKYFEAILSSESSKMEDIDKLLQEHLKISLSDCTEALSVSLQERAEEMIEDLFSIAPYGDYSKLTEDPEVILKFLQEEAIKPENWVLEFMEVRKKGDQLLELVFFNKAVDDGALLKGFVFVGISGKIRHVFPQVNS